MKRRNFIGLAGATGGLLTTFPGILMAVSKPGARQFGNLRDQGELSADVVIAGGGLGGVAAALSALRNGLRVILTEETDWIGGQLTQQGVPPDEHRWIETHGATQSYRAFREGVRAYYKKNYPLTDAAKGAEFLNPGGGGVSRLCHEPRVALAVMYAMLNPYLSSGKLLLLLDHKAVSAEVSGNKVKALKVQNRRDGSVHVLHAPYFVDATELGDLLPMTGTEHVRGAESKAQTRELHAAATADPENQQAFTVCFAMDYVKGKEFVIEKPEMYDFWRSHVPPLTPSWSGKLLELKYSKPATLVPADLGFHPEGVRTGNVLNLWNYRRIIDKNNFQPGFYEGDLTIVNWPQNDYMLGNLDGAEEEFNFHVYRAKQLSLSLFYWLQTEVPRPDGGHGWPGLRLRGDVMGTEDGMAKYPYVRESRRIEALFTVLEEHVGTENRGLVLGKTSGYRAADFYDSVGIGSYHIDLHPSSKGNNYIDFPSLPFEIPLGALIPKRMENLLPANKNIGTTHVTNGCYRLHPVEWSIGEAVGLLVHQALKKSLLPRDIRESKAELHAFQELVRQQGIDTRWPNNE